MPCELFELKVIVEADDWHDLSDLMGAVDRAMQPHRETRDGGRLWSVVASRLPEGQARDLLWFIERCSEGAPAEPPTDKLSA